MPRLFKSKLLSLSLCALLSNAWAQPNPPAKNHYHVIIIGAGVAGLETARYLKQHGENNFIILEARNRMGGRAWTVHPKNPVWQGAYLDMGAAWIHGAGPKNPIMRLAKQWKLALTPSDYSSTAFYQANGKPLSPSSLKKNKLMFAQFNEQLDDAHDDITPALSKQSVSDAAVQFIQQHHLSRKQQHGFLYQISYYLEQEYGADITQLSMLWFTSDSEFAGQDMLFNHGYKSFIDHLAQDLKNNIRFKQVVKKINYHDKNAIRVTTNDGITYTGRYVVSTLPMGVLQKGVVQFIPRLPQNKQIAIHQHINAGIANKIDLVFPHVFWHQKEFILRVPNAYWTGKHWKNKGRWIEFINLNDTMKKPILTAYVSGGFARQLQNKSKQTIINEAMQVLRKIYGNNIPNPTASIITRWGKDPYTLGAYSSLRPGALPNGKDFIAMSQPVNGHLLFAGEATTRDYPGTIHGAYLTGIRAGKDIILKLIRKGHLSNNS